MVSKINKNAMRVKRHIRVRGKISGTPECPRLNVFRSNANIYAQIIDDVNGVTLRSPLRVLPATARPPRRSVCCSLSGPRPRASSRSRSTVAAMCIMAVLPHWLRAPAKADSTSKEEEKKWLTIVLPAMSPSSLRKSST